jgi:D-beta-D-heptose 7-phosphate kinase/D-beta-D-heptose 1-phosphate adenosyltransferase
MSGFADPQHDELRSRVVPAQIARYSRRQNRRSPRPMRRAKDYLEPQNESPAALLPKVLPPLRPVRILVVGEMILDRYVWGAASRISPEAPIPVLRVERREYRMGNAAFVMANLQALGAEVRGLSAIGRDANGMLLRRMMVKCGIKTDSIVAVSGRPTIVKERFLGSVQSAGRATQQLLRVDEEDTRPLAAPTERVLKEKLAVELETVQAVLISDINKGLLTPSFLRAIIDGARRRETPVIIDPRVSSDYSIYRGATALTPNRFETEAATGVAMNNRDAWEKGAKTLTEQLDLRACLVTLDREGMFLYQRDARAYHISTSPRDAYDVTGAGDVVLAVFGLMVALGESFSAAAALSNLAAGLEVERLGAEVVTRAQLEAALKGQRSDRANKVISLPELKQRLETERQVGRKIVFTNGCFDLLHAGHIESLNFARAQGDILVVGLNSDRSVRQLKGAGRPVYPASERARILAALECVNYVVIFDDTRAERIVREVAPDVLVKGEDYRGRVVDGADRVRARGGRVVLAPLLDGRSTSETLANLQQRSVK